MYKISARADVDELMERMQSIISCIPYDTFTGENLKLRKRKEGCTDE